jgi:hypothetical protein
MDTRNIETKAYGEKISAQLQQVKSQIEAFEGRAKGKMAQAEIEAINHLKTNQHEIEKKRQELKTSDGTNVDQIKSEIDAEVAKLRTSLEQFAAKFKKAS